jgi:predicted transcriptional regulator
MANIKDIAARHNINLDIGNKSEVKINPAVNIDQHQKHEGRFRRAWLDNVTESKQGLNRVQTGGEVGSNRVQTESLDSNETPFKPCSNLVQTGFKQGLNRVLKLQGNPYKVMVFLIQNRSIEDPYLTEKFSVTDIAESTGLSRESVKTVLKFLKKNNLIFMSNSHTGIYGWSSYRLEKSFTDKLFKQGLNRVQTGGISSSNYNNLTTTTSELPDEWDELDISGLSKMNFTKTKLKEIYNFGCEYENVRRSINAASYDIKAGKEVSLALFMSTVKMKKSEYSAIAKGYEDPLLKASEENKRRLAERAEALRKDEEQMFEDSLVLWVNENILDIQNALKNHNLSLLNAFNSMRLKHPEVKKFLVNYYMEKAING